MTDLSTRMTFSDEQGMLLDTAMNFCREKSDIHTVRALLGNEDGFDRAVWREMVALGWSGIAVPERFGGTGLSLAEATVIAEPMGRYLLAAPFVSTQLFVQGLLAGGDAVQLEALLPRITPGAIGTVALFEQEGDWNLSHIETTAIRHGANVQLNGVKTLVRDAAVAEFLLVSVSLDGAPALVILPSEVLPDARRQRETVIDETLRCYQLDLNALTIPASSLITGSAAAAGLRAIRDGALLLASAEAAGGSAAVLALTVEYLNTRVAFGRKIGSFQSLKHTCADILVGLERARSHVYHAAALISGNEDAEAALSMAKAEAGDTFTFAGDRAVQFHGGFGFTFECDAQLFLRRALWLQYTFGDSAHHRRRLADLLLPLDNPAA